MFHITADNPKGIAYDYLIKDPAQAAVILKNIHTLGGENLKVNGNLVTV